MLQNIVNSKSRSTMKTWANGFHGLGGGIIDITFPCAGVVHITKMYQHLYFKIQVADYFPNDLNIRLTAQAFSQYKCIREQIFCKTKQAVNLGSHSET